MPSTTGFTLRKHIFRVTKCVSDRPWHRFGNFCCMSRKLLNFLKIDPKFMSTGLKSGCVSLTDDEGQRGAVPKGLMAVYIGREDHGGGELKRVLVPVVYFNHPLFGELLREAEEKYGLSQQGGITIPCGVSEFERVKTRVAAVSRCRSGPRWRKALRLFVNWSKLEDGME